VPVQCDVLSEVVFLQIYTLQRLHGHKIINVYRLQLVSLQKYLFQLLEHAEVRQLFNVVGGSLEN